LMDAQAANIRQMNIIAESQKNTDRKIVTEQELAEWWGEYKKIVRVAVKSDPQLMEKVGIVVPTRK
jgi:hypothetical protein